VLFAEIGGAQHAFDVFLSPRSVPVIEGVVAFLAESHRRHLRRRDAEAPRRSAQVVHLEVEAFARLG
jgi:hypothetical protein